MHNNPSTPALALSSRVQDLNHPQGNRHPPLYLIFLFSLSPFPFATQGFVSVATSMPYEQEPARVASPSPHRPHPRLFISVSSTIIPPCTAVADVAAVHHATTATARPSSSLIIPPSSTALSPIALQHPHVHPRAAMATATAFIATPLTVIALPPATAAAAATATTFVATTLRKPHPSFSSPRHRLRPTRETSTTRRHAQTRTPRRRRQQTAHHASIVELRHAAAANTKPRLTEDGQHLRSPGGVRTARALALH